jgi:hypothetical protein
MKYKGFCALAGMVFLSSAANGQQLQVSEKYPLQAHIVSVEMEQQQHFQDGTGGTSTWHLMKAEIDGKTYGLAVLAQPFRHRNWLHTGFYPVRQTKRGFEFEYMDGGKLRHEELRIVSEQ